MIIAEANRENAIYQLRTDSIFVIKFLDDVICDMHHVEFANAFLEKHLKFNCYVNVFEFKSFSSVSKEVRKWASKKSNRNVNSVADAIVCKNLPQKMIANFYLKINKPDYPTKIFSDFEKAVKWAQEKITDLCLVDE